VWLLALLLAGVSLHARAEDLHYTWNPVTGAKAYRLYLGDQAGVYSRTAIYAAGVTSALVTGLTTHQPVYARIEALDKKKEYALCTSSEVMVIPGQANPPVVPLEPLVNEPSPPPPDEPLDLVDLLEHFGARQGEERYDPACDLNGDLVIDGKDLALFLSWWRPRR